MRISNIFGVLALTFTFCAAAKADNVNFFTSVTSSDLTQLGRLSRNNVPQDWSGSESYSGEVNTTTTYYFKTFTYASTLFTGGRYIEVTTFDPNNSGFYFISAYANSYNPTNKSFNWLGDAGFSGNYQTNDGGDFQVILPTGANLVLVLNTTVAGTTGLGAPFQVNFDNYSSSMYDPPVPEPSTLMMAGTGLLTLLGAARRRFRTS